LGCCSGVVCVWVEFYWLLRLLDHAGGRLLDLPERGEKGGEEEKKEEKGEGKKGRKGRPLTSPLINVIVNSAQILYMHDNHGSRTLARHV